ncbi:saccharopine dehydrogenase-like oxidoreductase [Caerostris darwini]|uniref:Saccharopine dehydrogenase-like oxidoreductase n=1 Tax=Caerostris darwini TaxID=1538125 RepID=A0AAV4P881_9ARAC|nr:saccharopine dehydrogenase-like oxidoreductase [Caerostris darwini]
MGASGLTGRYAIEELSYSVKSSGVKWAIAGRNLEKLKSALDTVQEYLGNEINIKDVPVIKADVGDSLSVLEMCKRTKLLLNCVGPYNLYGGEMIVINCIQCKTHCIDISAEIKYLDTVQANYFNVAREKGVYIIEACGLGSLPTDYGIALLMKKFPGGLESVEYFIEFIAESQRMTTGYGTYLSGVHSITDYFNSSEYRKQVEANVFRKKITDTSDSVTSYIKRFPERDVVILGV